MQSRRIWVLCAAVFMTAWMPAGANEPGANHIAVVVSRRWDTPSEISLTMLRRVYFGTVTRWAGTQVERYELAPRSRARGAFAGVVFRRTERELEDYWLEQALTGGAIPPREVSGVREMIEAVADRSGVIGYLPLGELLPADRSRLRVLAVGLPSGSTSPGDPQYPIQIDQALPDEVGMARE